MQFSRPLKSSAHSLPSPDGKYIASLINTTLTLRTTQSLTIFRTIPLHENFSSTIRTFCWSADSSRILISSVSGIIRIFSATNTKFSALIKDPTSATAKPTYICFGRTHDEVIAWTDFGLKLTVFNLVSKTSIDIASPKFWAAGNVNKGFGYRPKTGHLALLSRREGKDVVSVHKRDSYVVDRSWYSDTIDAQSLSWSPDGKWLAVVESAGHGHKIIFYTADGHLFRSWKGPRASGVEEDNLEYGAGVRSIEWTKDGEYLAVADFSSKITLLSIPKFVEIVRLEHITIIKPAQSRQVWQETVLTRAQAAIAKVEQRQYSPVTAVVCPPASTPAPSSSSVSTEPKPSTAALTIDVSGTLIAARTESLPTIVFIWDIASKLLKSVLIQHAPVAKLTWHPTISELLLIRCEGEDTMGVAYLWDPLFEVPKIVDFGGQLPEARVMGKSIVRWLASEEKEDGDEGPANLFFSDAQDAILACLSEDVEGVPWVEAKSKAVDIYGQAEDIPLNLDDDQNLGQEKDATIMSLGTEDAGSEMDDTFEFKKSAMR